MLPISCAPCKRAGRTLLIGLGLDRLEADGFVTSSGSGDRHRRSYQFTQLGEGALVRAKAEGKQFATATEDPAAADEGQKAVPG